jgi:hydroxymethylpyrimidine pyrophosphatase-like HAD family hydrolase
VQTHCFEVDVVEAVAADLRAAIPGIAFAAERSSGLFLESGFPDRREGDEGTVVGDLARLADEPVGKLLALAPGLPTAELLDRVRTVVGDRGHLADSGAHGLAEVNAVGVTKGAALAAWCADLAIEAPDVWAFGDMPGDLPMLRWAGRGYAVANAHPDVLTAASHRCGSNDEDGVVGILDIFINGFSLDH